MFCSNCGAELLPKASFCVSCGAPTSDELNREESVIKPGSASKRSGRGKWLLGTLVVAAAAAAGGYLYVNNLAKARLDEMLAEIEAKVTLTYADARANPFTQAVIIEGINVTSIKGQPVDGLTIDRLQVKGAVNRESDPEKLDIRIDGLKLDIARVGPKWGEALMMDAGVLEFDSHLDYEFSRSAGNLDVNEFEIVAHDMATVRASLNLGNVPADAELSAEAIAQPATSIRRAEFMIEDAVFIDHLIRKTAERQKMSPEELDGKIVTGIFVDRNRPEYNEQYDQIRQRAQSKGGRL